MFSGQGQNINKTDYYSHGKVLLPKDIACGDIIKANNNKVSHIILGFVYNAERRVFQKIHTVALTREISIPSHRAALFVSSNASRNGDVTGVDLPAHIYTDRTGLYRLSNYYTDGGRIERIGRVSPEYFKRILKALDENNRHTLPYIKEGRTYVPSLQHLAETNETDIAPGLVPYGQIDDYDRALLLRDLANPDLTMDGDRVYAEHVDTLRQAQREGYLGYLRGRERDREFARSEAALNHRGRSSAILSAPLPNIAGSFDAVKAPCDYADKIQPDARQIVRADRGTVGQPPELERLQDAFRERAPICKIALPKHLWQGRYLMLRINSLVGNDEFEKGGTAYRPCAVWNAYTDKNTGDLAGFDLHPVTREEAHHFKFKMPVYPLKTNSRREGVLIADCIIRVPLSGDYFHENPVSNFFELTPEKISKFMDRKAAMSAMKVSPHIIGLQTVPDDWEEVRLDPTPSLQQLQKWAQGGHVKFDGHLTDIIRDRARHRSPV